MRDVPTNDFVNDDVGCDDSTGTEPDTFTADDNTPTWRLRYAPANNYAFDDAGCDDSTGTEPDTLYCHLQGSPDANAPNHGILLF